MMKPEPESKVLVPRRILEKQTKEELKQFQKKKAQRKKNSRFGDPVYIVCTRCRKGPHHGPYSLRKTRKGMFCQNCK